MMSEGDRYWTEWDKITRITDPYYLAILETRFDDYRSEMSKLAKEMLANPEALQVDREWAKVVMGPHVNEGDPG